MTAPILELQDLHAAYGRIEVLRGVDLAVPEGQIVALLGPNGAGKTTTLKVVSGQMRPTSGQVILAGVPVTGVPHDQLARAGVCTIPEGRGIFPNLTVRENLRMMSFLGTSADDVEETAYARFPRLGERRAQTAGLLSGGEQQMLALSRGLATDPAVLLLDELSMGLAPLIVEELYDHVRTVTDDGVTVLLVEQFARVALAVADTAAVMVNGRIPVVGHPDDVSDHVEAAYLGT